MIEKLLGLYQTKRWLFFVLIIPVAIAFIYKMLMDRNVAGGKQDVKDAERKDAKLQDEQQAAEQEAKRLQEEAEDIERDIAKTIDDVEEDWHKKQ